MSAKILYLNNYRKELNKFCQTYLMKECLSDDAFIKYQTSNVAVVIRAKRIEKEGHSAEDILAMIRHMNRRNNNE